VLTSYFCVCNHVFYHWRQALVKCYNTPIGHCAHWTQNMLIHHTIFYCDLFSWFIFLAECKILNFADVGRHTCTASLHGRPLVCYQWNGLKLPIVSNFVFKYFMPSIFNWLCSVYCRETSCTNLLLHNPCWVLCWLANILSKVCLRW